MAADKDLEKALGDTHIDVSKLIGFGYSDDVETSDLLGNAVKPRIIGSSQNVGAQ